MLPFANATEGQFCTANIKYNNLSLAFAIFPRASKTLVEELRGKGAVKGVFVRA